MKKITPLLLITLMLPQVTFAAWWNPFSWVKGVPEESHIQTVEKEIVEEDAQENSKEELPVESNNIQPMVKERVIKVTDPTLQAQINALIAENTSLRNRILELETKLSKYIGIEKQNEILRINQQKELEVEAKAKLGAQQQAQLETDERRRALNVEIAQLNADKVKLGADESRCPRGGDLNTCSAWAFGHSLFPELGQNKGLAYGEAYRRIEVRIAGLKVELAGL